MSEFVDGAFYWVRHEDGEWDIAAYTTPTEASPFCWSPTGDDFPHTMDDFAEIGPCLGKEPPKRDKPEDVEQA